MTIMIAQAAAGGYLVFLGSTVSTRNAKSAIFYNWLPIVAGMINCFYAFGQFMGWPI